MRLIALARLSVGQPRQLNRSGEKSLLNLCKAKSGRARSRARPAQPRSYSDCVLNVLQLLMSPEAKPALNQRWRWAEVPWVNESGTA